MTGAAQTGASHPRHRLDPALVSPIRLSIMVGLAEVTEAEAKVIAGLVEISLSTMSNHMSALADAGYVTVRKGYVGQRPCTWLSLTPTGRTQLSTHLDALRAIASHG